MPDASVASGPTQHAIMTKAEIRSKLMGIRNALLLQEQKQRSDQIMRKIMSMEAYQGSRVVMGYSSFGSEVDTRPLLEQVLDEGKMLVLPKINPASNTLSLHAVSDLGAQMVEGTWGIHEPSPTLCKEVDPRVLDFILIPGLAFDSLGGRLGYGKGYYDKLLSSCLSAGNRPWLVAGAFGFQLIDRVPMEAHDIAIHAVVTETDCISCEADDVLKN